MPSLRLIVFMAALLAMAASWMVFIHFDAAWACLFAVALGWGLAAGAAWEREKTSGLAAENRQLREVAERHRDELCEAQKLSSHLQSEASLALRDSEALY